jgi:hypothetical protein
MSPDSPGLDAEMELSMDTAADDGVKACPKTDSEADIDIGIETDVDSGVTDWGPV